MKTFFTFFLLAFLVFGVVFFMRQQASLNIDSVVDVVKKPETTDTKDVLPVSIAQTKEAETIHILFAGDMMFDRYVRVQSEKHGKAVVFEGISDELLSADVVVANLEGPITKNVSKSVGSLVGESWHFLFTFDPEWANVLYEKNIRIVNIGNNHILNFGEAGLVETRKYLREAGVKLFGDPLDETLRAYVLETKGRKIGFVNYNQFSKNAEKNTLSDIERLRSRVDLLFVSTHWGAEYVPATAEEKRLAHLFVDRGADVIIGSHPHVVQEKEIYNGKTIYYSLGNFVFDQSFSPETKRGLLVEVTISLGNMISFRDIPINISSDGRVGK